MKEERLQKILANAGVASRRACEDLILQGRVTVDDEVIDIAGTKWVRGVHRIKVDGKLVKLPKIYYKVLFKPRGVICSMYEDEEGASQKSVADYMAPSLSHILKPVGRLDVQTTGLIFMTNDGDFANRVCHPRYGVQKVYRVKIDAYVDDDKLEMLRKGVELDDGMARASVVRLCDRSKKQTMIEMVIHEGRNHIVRRMVEAIGHWVKRLSRIQIGNIRVGSLKSGGVRDLTAEEVLSFFKEPKKAKSTSSRSQSKYGSRPKAKPKGKPKNKSKGRPKGPSRSKPESGYKGKSEGGYKGKPEGGYKGKPKGGASAGKRSSSRSSKPSRRK